MMPTAAVSSGPPPTLFPSPSEAAGPVPGPDAPEVAFLIVFEDSGRAKRDPSTATIGEPPVAVEAPSFLAASAVRGGAEISFADGAGTAFPLAEVTTRVSADGVARIDDASGRPAAQEELVPDHRTARVPADHPADRTERVAQHAPCSSEVGTDAGDGRATLTATPLSDASATRAPMRAERPGDVPDLRSTGTDKPPQAPEVSEPAALADPRSLFAARTGEGREIRPAVATVAVLPATAAPAQAGRPDGQKASLLAATPSVDAGDQMLGAERMRAPGQTSERTEAGPVPVPAAPRPASTVSDRAIVTISGENCGHPVGSAPPTASLPPEAGERQPRASEHATGSAQETTGTQRHVVSPAPQDAAAKVGGTPALGREAVDGVRVSSGRNDSATIARHPPDHAQATPSVSDIALLPETSPEKSFGDVRALSTQRDVVSIAGAVDALPKGPLSDGVVLPDARAIDSVAAETILSESRTTDLRAAEARPAAEPVSPRLDLSRSGDQLTEIARRLPDGPVEVTLSPEELGKVRFAILGTEGQMSVQIVAERAETLDLLRRHIDVLASELREQGYDQVSFSFGQGGGGPGAEPGGTAPAGDEDRSSRDAPLRTEPVARPRSGDGSLDLRL